MDNNVLKVGSNEMELVDFRLHRIKDGGVYEGIYGINVAKVREIIKAPKLTELPAAPEYIEGIFDLRGVIIPVVNLAKWMNIETPDHDEKSIRVIIAEFNNLMVGFAVHDARRIRRISWNDIEPATFMSDDGVFDKSKITGVTKIENNEVLLILDLESVVEELGFYQPTTETEHGEIEQFQGTALILDDSSIARKLVHNAIRKMGLNVVEAKDGKEGLEKLEELYGIFGSELENELKIIISDVEMPQMDGFHFASHVKRDERFHKIPIVFNSSISDHFSELRGQEAGADAYLTKFDATTFYTTVANAIKSNNKTLTTV